MIRDNNLSYYLIGLISSIKMTPSVKATLNMDLHSFRLASDSIRKDNEANLLLHFQHPCTHQGGTPAPAVHYYNHHELPLIVAADGSETSPVQETYIPTTKALQEETGSTINGEVQMPNLNHDNSLISAHTCPQETATTVYNPYHNQTKESLVNHTILAANTSYLQYPNERASEHPQLTENASNCSKGSTHHFDHPYHHNNNHSGTNCKSTKWCKNGYGESVELVLGKFTPEETAKIKSSIEQYCNFKQISIQKLCSDCHHVSELKGAWMEIARCLPHRSVQSIYRHGLRQWHPYKRGPWSEREVHYLGELVQRYGKKWSFIQTILYRSADACRDKYREHSSDYIKGRWKKDESDFLITTIREVVNAPSDIIESKQLQEFISSQNIVIPWSTISKHMQKRSRLSCFKKWQKITSRNLSKGRKASFMANKQEKSSTPADDYIIGADGRVSILDGSTNDKSTSEEDSNILNEEHVLDEEAKMAAQTVEAVDLPVIESPNGISLVT